MASLTRERADLLRRLNDPGVTSIPVRARTAGEISVTAEGPLPEDRIVLIIEPPQPGSANIYNLLDYAPTAWWANSKSLLDAFDRRWLIVDESAPEPLAAPLVIPDGDVDIQRPPNQVPGDVLVFDGENWVSLPAGTVGYVLTSNGAAQVPSYQPPTGGGGGGGNVLTGQTTNTLTTGDVAYALGGNSWYPARSDGTVLQANVGGAYLGLAGQIALTGTPLTANFTSAGGQPVVGALVFLAAAADDGGTAVGKLTATPPTTGYLTAVGLCVDNSSYGALKRCVIVFDPRPPIGLAS